MMRSGTNQLHGTGYEYLVNEDLNARVPFTNSATDICCVLASDATTTASRWAALWSCPKCTTAMTKPFSFSVFEQYREITVTNNVPSTVSKQNYRSGNFAQALTNRNIGTDGPDRRLIENTIYDPATDRIINDVLYRDSFPSNTIPLTRMDLLH